MWTSSSVAGPRSAGRATSIAGASPSWSRAGRAQLGDQRAQRLDVAVSCSTATRMAARMASASSSRAALESSTRRPPSACSVSSCELARPAVALGLGRRDRPAPALGLDRLGSRDRRRRLRGERLQQLLVVAGEGAVAVEAVERGEHAETLAAIGQRHQERRRRVIDAQLRGRDPQLVGRVGDAAGAAAGEHLTGGGARQREPRAVAESHVTRARRDDEVARRRAAG